MKLPRMTAHLVHGTWSPANSAYRNQALSLQPTGVTPSIGGACGCTINDKGKLTPNADFCTHGYKPHCYWFYADDGVLDYDCECLPPAAFAYS